MRELAKEARTNGQAVFKLMQFPCGYLWADLSGSWESNSKLPGARQASPHLTTTYLALQRV
ncbi:hypothetical protein LEMLEM_LOCUS19763, partial [Lemmus lemmus]